MLQKTHYLSVKKTSRSKIPKELFTTSSENNNELTHIVSGQTAESILNELVYIVFTVLKRIRNKCHNS